MRTDYRARYTNIGDKGDKILGEKTVSIAGIGTIGATVASMLGREGVGLRLVDMGRVQEEDMHRLAIFYEEDITRFKVKQAKARIIAINPNVDIKCFHEEIGESNVFLLKGDIIVDATNTKEINELTFKHAQEKKTPYICVNYAGDKIKILVAHKKVALKTLEKLKVGTIKDKGVFGPSSVLGGSLVTAQVLKLLLDEKISAIIDIDAWKGTIKTTKL